MELQKELGTSVLALLSGVSLFEGLVRGTPFMIPALSGELAPPKEGATFTCPQFGTKSAPTKETAVEVYGVNAAITFKEALKSLSDNFAELALTECQIAEFLNTHIALLRAVKHSTFFLCNSENGFFIVHCTFWGKFPHVSRFPFDYHYKLEPNNHCHLIVPKQSSE